MSGHPHDNPFSDLSDPFSLANPMLPSAGTGGSADGSQEGGYSNDDAPSSMLGAHGISGMGGYGGGSAPGSMGMGDHMDLNMDAHPIPGHVPRPMMFDDSVLGGLPSRSMSARSSPVASHMSPRSLMSPHPRYTHIYTLTYT
ncbi:hypothetical protein KIPB_001797 [Kipferlia bialata]|uniref:Uncharacterized protein n=1 Tax=Kipferlia bialata TaxID=797122 RepID=A0A9K3CR43_9EUKA|nr:hypothetical protein KIPB_001797 [Kipferlia bialata]|eukprot:g1797.t1